MALTGNSSAQFGSSMQDGLVGLPILALALAVWLVDRHSRGGELTPACGGNFLRNLGPELAALMAVALLAAMLLGKGDHNGVHEIPSEDHQVWESITNEWQILTTADSLIGLQAMLRVLLLSSAVLRFRQAEKSPLASEPAAFLLLAALARTATLVLSPPDIYHLDGPLGGMLNIIVEALAIPLLLRLSLSAFKQSMTRIAVCLVAAVAAAVVAKFNRLALADAGDEYLDVLFSASELLELLGAGAFLLRSICTNNVGSFCTFAHLVLPLQQFLGAYFMLFSWGLEPFLEVPQLVGAGHPLLLLQASGLVEVGFYLIALAIYLGNCVPEKDALHPELTQHLEV
eukprot:CAMPEP_0197651206 /NCGR_PEP_ID=MMETSP1338-20131121/31432_1 /TAXON_ID=43686 ORGANISM="Pelagodinium beii, Strain RCC1491" /NCGR_SAMPLE_ID=MMETSP1338 /ASSEMBLY_ACC=CAM_ASM_000754 /LENGTH=342 /DNA_ID=CAMNT_0043225775 /DNA_START=104 /DNA_END=1132 /DNA_ORIENTATION=+